jgi:hypothetical protein
MNLDHDSYKGRLKIFKDNCWDDTMPININIVNNPLFEVDKDKNKKASVITQKESVKQLLG